VLKSIARRILPFKDGKFLPSLPPNVLQRITDLDLVVAKDAVWEVAAEQQPPLSGAARHRLLAWTVADARGAAPCVAHEHPLAPAVALKVGKRLEAQALKVRAAIDAVRDGAAHLGKASATAAERTRMQMARDEVYVGFIELGEGRAEMYASAPPKPAPLPPRRPPPAATEPPPPSDEEDLGPLGTVEEQVNELARNLEDGLGREAVLLDEAQKLTYDEMSRLALEANRRAGRAFKMAEVAQERASKFAAQVLACATHLDDSDRLVETTQLRLQNVELQVEAMKRDLADVTAERDAYRAELDALRAAGGVGSSGAPMPACNPDSLGHAPGKPSPVRSLFRAVRGSGPSVPLT
jgi:hypothetical protein